jgi:hypothetical protein
MICIIASTRQDWQSQGQEAVPFSPSPTSAEVLAHPLSLCNEPRPPNGPGLFFYCRHVRSGRGTNS